MMLLILTGLLWLVAGMVVRAQLAVILGGASTANAAAFTQGDGSVFTQGDGSVFTQGP